MFAMPPLNLLQRDFLCSAYTELTSKPIYSNKGAATTNIQKCERNRSSKYDPNIYMNSTVNCKTCNHNQDKMQAPKLLQDR
jgi:hypothetical protein